MNRITIIAQLGGNRFLTMTGAKDLVNTANGLQFAIGRGASNNANKVVVTLTERELPDHSRHHGRRTC